MFLLDIFLLDIFLLDIFLLDIFLLDNLSTTTTVSAERKLQKIPNMKQIIDFLKANIQPIVLCLCDDLNTVKLSLSESGGIHQTTFGIYSMVGSVARLVIFGSDTTYLPTYLYIYLSILSNSPCGYY
ncbi:hypothetical protein DPMN_088376 [Dreissena polymorpha]|uniref:Uncharacterized protein n=1 Tax=Dreissena polymorpha TaxID=45954 RepID=A0A9D4KTZ7_DREPO|nr:hypothetical protein DPMN_088376 [Dreissena polymorpha]